mgnify:CR=1 FL=1
MEIELTDFKIAVFDIFKVTEAKDIGEKVLDCVLSHDEQKYELLIITQQQKKPDKFRLKTKTRKR